MADTLTDTHIIDTLATDYIGIHSPSHGIIQRIFAEISRKLPDLTSGDPNKPEDSYAACGPLFMSKIYRQPARNGLALSISGSAAARYTDIIAEYDDVVKLSRIDLQVTISESKAPDIEDLYSILSNPQQFPWRQTGKTPECTLINNTRGGKTLYIGKRTGQLMTRIYIKPIDGVKTVRWELEIKSRMARALQEQGILWDRNVAATTARAVIAGYPDGVQQLLAPFAECIEQGTGEVYRQPKLGRDEATLEWFAGTVVPALKKACAGKLREEVLGVFEAYGFDIRHINEYNRIRERRAEVSAENLSYPDKGQERTTTR
jgi:hypothetical protein